MAMNYDIYDAIFDLDKEKLEEILNKDPNQINLRLNPVAPVEEATGYDLQGKYCLPLEVLVAYDEKKHADKTNELFDILVAHGAKPEAVSAYENNTLIHDAASMGNTYIMRQALKAGVDINAIDEHGNTALHYAVSNLHLKASQFIINHGGELSTTIQNKEDKLPIAMVKDFWKQNEKYHEAIEKVTEYLKPITENQLQKVFSEGFEPDLNHHKRVKP